MCIHSDFFLYLRGTSFSLKKMLMWPLCQQNRQQNESVLLPSGVAGEKWHWWAEPGSSASFPYGYTYLHAFACVQHVYAVGYSHAQAACREWCVAPCCFQHHLWWHMHSHCAWIWKALPSFWLSFLLYSEIAERPEYAICCFTKQKLFPGWILHLICDEA